MVEAEQWVSIGRIGRAKGLRGEVRVQIYNVDSELLETVRSVAAGKSPEDLKPLSVRNFSREPKTCVLAFEEVSTREGAEKLTGKEIFVRRNDLPKLKDGEYYCRDLVGFDVVAESGEKIGVLRNVMSTASNDIYEIDGTQGEILLPAIPEVVLSVDAQARRITVRVPEVVDAI